MVLVIVFGSFYAFICWSAIFALRVNIKKFERLNDPGLRHLYAKRALKQYNHMQTVIYGLFGIYLTEQDKEIVDYIKTWSDLFGRGNV